jgi:hypothetical protein
MFDMIRELGQITSPGTLLPISAANTLALQRLAETASAGTRNRLWLLAGRYAEFTGWMAQESGDDDAALEWTERAVRYAAEGGDHTLGAYALVRRAEIAMYQCLPRDTVALARHAQQLDCGNRIRGLAAQREAQGHALAGDARQCRQALDHAARLLNRAKDDGPLPVLGTSNVEDLTGLAMGFALVDLGEPGKASQLLRSQLEQTPATAHRMKARIGARYTLALVSSGAVEEGCAEVPRLLDWYSSADSATIRLDLQRVLNVVNRWPAAVHVRWVLPDLTAAVSQH